jgi:hypothetical protein
MCPRVSANFSAIKGKSRSAKNTATSRVPRTTVPVVFKLFKKARPVGFRQSGDFNGVEEAMG